jgi:hypothetical protein
MVVSGGSVAAIAQTQGSAERLMPRDYRGVRVRVGGIFVTPVPNAPFTARVETVSHNVMADGTEHVVTTTAHIARSSSGRIRNELRQLVPPGYSGEPRLLSVHTYDPSSRLSVFMNTQLHLARETVLRAPERAPADELPPGQQLQRRGYAATDLGTQSVDGVPLRGTRKTLTIPAEMSGTGKPIVVTDDYWYSEALSIYMIIRHNDPRTGEQLIAVTNVERTEPPAELFAVPAEYKVVDETTPEAPQARQ